MTRCRPVVSSLTLLNHRLLAAMPPASSDHKVSLMVAKSIRSNGLQFLGLILAAGR